MTPTWAASAFGLCFAYNSHRSLPGHGGKELTRSFVADIDPMVDTGHGKASLPPYVNAAPLEEDLVLCIHQVRRLGSLCSAYNRKLAGPTCCLGIIIELYILEL